MATLDSLPNLFPFLFFIIQTRLTLKHVWPRHTHQLPERYSCLLQEGQEDRSRLLAGRPFWLLEGHFSLSERSSEELTPVLQDTAAPWHHLPFKKGELHPGTEQSPFFWPFYVWLCQGLVAATLAGVGVS